jgi:alpha-glucosidase
MQIQDIFSGKKEGATLLITGFLFFSMLSFVSAFSQNNLLFYAPDSTLELRINLSDTVSWQLQSKGQMVVQRGVIHLKLEPFGDLGINSRLKTQKQNLVDELVQVPVPYRKKQILNKYRLVQLQMAEGWMLEARLYSNGFAYRICLQLPDSAKVISETARWTFAQTPEIWYPHYDPRPDVDAFHTSFEGQYRKAKLDTFSTTRISYAPLVATLTGNLSVLISDANLVGYPGMHLKASDGKTLHGVFAAYPEKERMVEGEFPAWVVDKRADYLARVEGNQKLPFRAFLVAHHPVDLPDNDLLYLLGDPSKINDPSWILPGKGTDEWICGINLFNVPFKAGVNTASYKYYIDFAKRFGFDQIMLDAGWSNYKDLFDINPAVNMDTLLAYAKAKGIRLMLWTLSATLDKQLEPALAQFQKWGIRHIMTDFMDRDDQQMVSFYHRVAEACARHQIAVMFHGAYPPKGLNRTWPNAITQEGVMGAEWNIWSELATPSHNVALAFTRMVAGPLDYEPGLLLNAQPDQFRPIGKNPMSIGTRCHQLAMYVVYDSPLQIFSGNPSQGLLEPEFMEILGGIPVTWEETRYLAGEIGSYIVNAKRHGNDWYLAGMNDLTEREITLDMSWLTVGSYEWTRVEDGVNAASYGADYNIQKQEWKNEKQWKVNMAPGGGFLWKLVKKE